MPPRCCDYITYSGQREGEKETHRMRARMGEETKGKRERERQKETKRHREGGLSRESAVD